MGCSSSRELIFDVFGRRPRVIGFNVAFSSIPTAPGMPANAGAGLSALFQGLFLFQSRSAISRSIARAILPRHLGLLQLHVYRTIALAS